MGGGTEGDRERGGGEEGQRLCIARSVVPVSRERGEGERGEGEWENGGRDGGR